MMDVDVIINTNSDQMLLILYSDITATNSLNVNYKT